MPELPEVETVRARIAPLVEGRVLRRVEIFDSRLTRPHDPAVVAAELEGERVRAVDRRGKYLLARFDSGRVLVIHLRMTGALLHRPGGTGREESHRRAVVTLDDGAAVVYRDTRRFGTWLLMERDEAEAYLTARLGGEPLGPTFTAVALAARLKGRNAPVKAALLDQRTVAGLGNIYVDEALWRARIHPLRRAGDLGPPELRSLHRAIRRALELGIARQGATLSDYRTPDGGRGSMQNEFRVYGRAGAPCDRCGAIVAKIRVGGRGTSFCPGCQLAPVALPG